MFSPESAESKRLRFSDDETRSWAVALMPGVVHLQSGWTLCGFGALQLIPGFQALAKLCCGLLPSQSDTFWVAVVYWIAPTDQRGLVNCNRDFDRVILNLQKGKYQ